MIAGFVESEGTVMGQFVHENTLGLVKEISVFSSRNQNDDQIRPVILGTLNNFSEGCPKKTPKTK